MAMGDTRLEGARRPSALKLKYFARFIAFLSPTLYRKSPYKCPFIDKLLVLPVRSATFLGQFILLGIAYNAKSEADKFLKMQTYTYNLYLRADHLKIQCLIEHNRQYTLPFHPPIHRKGP